MQSLVQATSTLLDIMIEQDIIVEQDTLIEQDIIVEQDTLIEQDTDVNHCMVCFDKSTAATTIVCPNGHLICQTCFNS